MSKIKWRISLFITLAPLITATIAFLKEPPILSTMTLSSSGQKVPVLDRWKNPIRVTYTQHWNVHDQKQLKDFPQLLKASILQQEDQRFYEHKGVDGLARINALYSNVKAGRTVRGASTITEQVVRILNPRPRNLFSKWLESFEAVWLEAKNSKDEIFEFYLNQVPFGKQRRGLVQAARLYFNRDLSTLNEREILALAVLIKSPVKLDIKESAVQVEKEALKLAERMRKTTLISELEYSRALELPWSLQESNLSIEASHFVRFVERKYKTNFHSVYETTLDPELQKFTQELLTHSLKTARKKHDVENAAVIIADHSTGEVLAWAVAENDLKQGVYFDAALVPRQPGSALKPFLYGLAFDSGWNASSLIEDAPTDGAVGNGLHSFKNYSRIHYGWLSLREALANSLNIPAIKLVREIGLENFWKLLKSMDFQSLNRPLPMYGEGLALGNGEVTLWEMINAYSMLARMGEWKPLRVIYKNEEPQAKRILSEESASLVGNILSDAHARRLEFGQGSVMRFPVQTAVKSGTSTDYRDAWAFGYNYKYVIGVWAGNLSNRTTRGMTGSSTPMMIVRGVLAKLSEYQETKPLFLSPKLQLKEISGGHGESGVDYFLNTQNEFQPVRIKNNTQKFELAKPSNGLFLAIDPRLPSSVQTFEFEVQGARTGVPIQWYINGDLFSQTADPKISWQLKKGKFVLRATQGHLISTRQFEVR